MSSAIVRDTFEATLRVAYPTLELVDVENKNAVLPKDARGKAVPFMACMYLASEEALGVGNAVWRERGTINVLIYALSGRGSVVATADALRNLLAGKNLNVRAPGIRLALTSAEPLTSYLGGAASTGVYDIGMVAIPYEFDFTR